METELIEFKKTTGELKEGIVSLASMLNKNGKGTLYFGVRNDGEVLGQQIGDRTLREISQGIANAIKPQIIPTIIIELCDDKNVIKVSAEGDEKPYSAYGKYYMRSADEDREISPQQLRNLMLSVSDSIASIEANNQALTFEQLKMLYAGNNLTLRENTFEQNLNLLTRDGTYNLMAAILADVNSYSIKVAVFRGTDKTDLVRRNEYGYKCMLVAVKQVLDYMEALNDTVVDVEGSLRKETKLFDFPCFREAWLNACLHNRWSRQTPPAVYMFENRIEILSVGGLPDGLTLEEFYEGKSKPVNLELQQIMVQLDYIEQTGHGVPLIVSKYGKEAFDITENFITVTIPLNREIKSKSDVKKDKKLLTDSKDKELLMLMKENSSISVSEMSRQVGLGTTTITKRIRRLKEEGFVERKGAKKKGQWIVKTK
ncbi:winged helix-turn-helix transcriptional regulator [Lachnospiraceae bacterium MD335]|nr:winged helix-turn-helix transcriptional regulator [Lachnospiraceae bacterium MD335]